MASLPAGELVDRWYTLVLPEAQRGGGGSGGGSRAPGQAPQLTLHASVRREPLLAPNVRDIFLHLVLAEDRAVASALIAALPDRADAADTIVALLAGNSAAVPFLMRLVELSTADAGADATAADSALGASSPGMRVCLLIVCVRVCVLC